MRLTLIVAAALLLVPLRAEAQREPVARPVTPPVVPPSRPAGPAHVAATVSAPGEVTITWAPVAGASAYDIGRLARPDGWRRVTRVAGDVTRYVDSGRDLSRPHMYQVVAIVGALASLPARSAELPPGASADSAAAATPATASLQPASCAANYAGGRVVCQSAVRDFTASFNGRMTVVAECPAGTYVVSGGWLGAFARGRVIVSRPRHVTGWEVVLEVPHPTTDESRQPGSIHAVAMCMPA